MLKPVGKALLVVALTLLIFAVWIEFSRREFARLAPKGTTVAEHLATMPEPLRYRVIQIEGKKHLVIFGPMRATLTFPSGGPVYVFGPDGHLVDWAPDAGDAGVFDERWPGLYSGSETTRKDAELWPDG